MRERGTLVAIKFEEVEGGGEAQLPRKQEE